MLRRGHPYAETSTSHFTIEKFGRNDVVSLVVDSSSDKSRGKLSVLKNWVSLGTAFKDISLHETGLRPYAMLMNEGDTISIVEQTRNS